MTETIHAMLDSWGYVFLFLAFCLGPFGIPVPNEITILTASGLANAGLLDPWSVYGVIASGLFVAVNAGYALGRLFGAGLIARIRQARLRRYAERGSRLLDRFGSIALLLAFFIPVVRYVMPLLAGAGGLRYRTFALYAYAGMLVWTLLFFGIGMIG
ncbi:DedA family protein [Cohnella nanjingensis]|uniref:VTT domain-containing protein n=1 Tax=Cohnella nanjingensis TaxID=1387779 RepID=A0A7X0RUF9_9BACL|nr:VTT domain-containing protein [Cohnella nanjingensis]MBB6673923.1 VTT domain-containing protein [Cohnella nanjingensis]